MWFSTGASFPLGSFVSGFMFVNISAKSVSARMKELLLYILILSSLFFFFFSAGVHTNNTSSLLSILITDRKACK